MKLTTNSKFQNTESKISRLKGYHKIAILTESFSFPFVAKTAMSLLRYRGQDVVAVIDSTQEGQTADSVFGFGGNVPVVASVEEVMKLECIDALFIGIAPPGGKLPDHWRPIILQALENRIDIVSGLHDFLSVDPSFIEASNRSGSHLIDVRQNSEKAIARNLNFREGCLRVHTVGQDCSVGKMVVGLEVQRELLRQGHDAQFLSTGQTGMMITGDGVPIDCVVSDFVNGSVESLVERNQQHDFLLVEGQGSISHPAYSAVTQGLLHGCAPQGLIYCYEVGRTHVKGLENSPLIDHRRLLEAYRLMANLRFPCQIVGIAINSGSVSAEEADAEREKMGREFGLPVCDVYRDGATSLVDAILELKKELSR